MMETISEEQMPPFLSLPIGKEELRQKKSVAGWLKQLAERTRTNKFNVLWRYLGWRHFMKYEWDPDILIQECEDGTNKTLIAHSKGIIEWTTDRRAMAWCTRATIGEYARTVRGFYGMNLIALPRTWTLRKNQVGPGEEDAEVRDEPKASDYLVMAKRVLETGRLTVRDRAVVLVKVQGFMDNSTLCRVFNYLAFPQLCRHFGTEDFLLWDPEKVPVHIDLRRTKTGLTHYTFVDRDAVAALKDWLEKRQELYGPIKMYPPKNGYFRRSDPIFVTNRGPRGPSAEGWDGHPWKPLAAETISYIFNKSGRRAGVNITPEDDLPPGRRQKRHYPFRAHEVRDVGVTMAASAGVPSPVINFFVGHSIDKLGYDKSPKNDENHYRQMYSRLAPFLNLVSGKEQKLKAEYDQRLVGEVQARDNEIADLKAEVARLKKSQETQNETVQALLEEIRAERQKELSKK
jgi:integrase